MRTIEGFQIKKIYAIGNALDMVDRGNKEDNLHLLIYGITGKDSLKELSYQEAGNVIEQLEKRKGNMTPPNSKDRRAKKYESVPGGITVGQQKKVWGLMYELKACDVEKNNIAIGDRLCGIIEKELHLSCGVKEPFKWIDYKNGNKLIEIIKKYIVSAKKAKEVVK